jgi:N-acetylmuramic acid 6-phosphate etherase
MLTEMRNPRSLHIDRMATLDMLQIMNDEDATVARAVRQVLPDIARAVDAIVECFRRGGRLIYVGAGTSGRLAVLDAAEAPPTFSTPPEMIQAMIAGGEAALTKAVEGAEDDRQAGYDSVQKISVSEKDVVVGIAASGRTPFVLGALEAANRAGAITIGIVCNAPSPLLEAAQIKIAALVGPEVIAGSTRLKAGTAQKMILNMLSTASMIRLGKVYGNLMVDVKVSNEKLAARARHIIMGVAGTDEDEAGKLLAQCHNEVKTAIVTHLLRVTPEAARALLARAGGMLGDVIGA